MLEVFRRDIPAARLRNPPHRDDEGLEDTVPQRGLEHLPGK
jgi:hypothetical protein